MVYVANTHSKNVTIIDGKTNTVTATVEASEGPWSIAINPTLNKIYVANRLSHKVTIIDGKTNHAIQQ